MHGTPADGKGDAPILPELLLLLALVLANGIFAGAEIAIVALRKTRLQELIDGGRSSARAVLLLKECPERFLATVQIGITVVGASAAAFGGASLAERIAPLLARIGWLAPHADSVALGLVIAFVSYLSIVLGELVPKSLALRSAETYALLVSRPLVWLSWLARPLVWFLTASSNAVLRPFGDRTAFSEVRHSAEELRQLVEEAAREGTVHPHACEIASRALDFGELTAGEVMVPRPQVVMLPRHATPEEVRRILLESTHSRMPVYEGRVDNVVGYVNVKDLLAFAWEQKLIVLEDVMRPAYFVPEPQRAVDLLQDMRRKRIPFAIVVDEQGGMSGIITFEDLVEELVGELFNEHSRDVPESILREPDGALVVSAGAPIREVNRALQAELPENGEWRTVAGLCLAITGRIPCTGERLELPNGLTLEIVDATARRVRQVRIRARRSSPAPALQPGEVLPP
jgi:putative hemolysin